MNLHLIVARFGEKWGPKGDEQWVEFLSDLREILEAYGRATLQHQSFPDTEHEHGEPI